MAPHPRITELSLCSGIGGIDLGLRLAIGPTYGSVCHVERSPYAVACLVARMEEGWFHPAPVWSDLSTFDGRPWRGLVDILSAGLPCQPYSVVGKRLGHNDERYVWPCFFRILKEVRPPLVFIENIPAILRWWRPIGEQLSGLGYAHEAGVYSAEEVGAGHRRERFFALAHGDDLGLEVIRAALEYCWNHALGDAPDGRGKEVGDPSGAGRERSPSYQETRWPGPFPPGPRDGEGR